MSNLYPYQKTGVDFLRQRGFAMLGDDPGLGKSAQALLAASRFDRNILILCPAIGVPAWEAQIKKWVPGPQSFIRVETYDRLALKANDKLREELRKYVSGGVLILDEAHYLKNPSSNRTQYVYGVSSRKKGVGLADFAMRVWALSGTFAPNHAGELYPHLRVAGETTLSRIEFEDKYCIVQETTYGRSIRGTKKDMIPELREMLRGIYLRRRKTEVLKDLPPLDFVTVDLSAPPDKSSAEKMALDDLARNMPDDDAFMERLSSNLSNPIVADTRREFGLAKVGVCIEWIEAQGFAKVIVFAHHRDVLDALSTGLAEYNPVRIDGSTSQSDRAAAVLKFQNDPNCGVFIGQIQAAGTAITLTAAKDVVIVEPSYVPAENYQAACRAHRIGQTDGVLCRFMSAGGIDHRIARILARKSRGIAAIFE